MNDAPFMTQQASTRTELRRGRVRMRALIVLGLLLCSFTYAQEANTERQEEMHDYKTQVTLWYEAFSTNDPTILERILSEHWVDIPSPPGTPPGPTGAKPLLAGLKTTFPDLTLTIQDILQDGDKVVVRAEMAGTQQEAFMGFPSKNRKMAIQVVDIHEFKGICRKFSARVWWRGRPPRRAPA